MRRFAFVVAIIGIGFLVGYLFKPARAVSSLKGLMNGEVVSIEGVVEEVRNTPSGKTLLIDGNSAFCGSCTVPVNSHVYVEGAVEEFDGRFRIRAFMIEELP